MKRRICCFNFVYITEQSCSNCVPFFFFDKRLFSEMRKSVVDGVHILGVQCTLHNEKKGKERGAEGKWRQWAVVAGLSSKGSQAA